MIHIGHDVVHIVDFRQQIADGASRFVQGTFTEHELATARGRPGTDLARHLAVRFAAKEAFVKAWSVSRWGKPPVIARAKLREIEVRSDHWGRPSLTLSGQLADLLGPVQISVSLSHDGPMASATVLLTIASEPKA